MTPTMIRNGVIVWNLSGNLNLMLNKLDRVSALACFINGEVGDWSCEPYILNSTMAKLADCASCVSRAKTCRSRLRHGEDDALRVVVNGVPRIPDKSSSGMHLLDLCFHVLFLG
jgi:hypothetical protein